MQAFIFVTLLQYTNTTGNMGLPRKYHRRYTRRTALAVFFHHIRYRHSREFLSPSNAHGLLRMPSNVVQDLYNQAISKLVEFIVASYHQNPNINFEVFVHKAEKLQEDDKIGMHSIAVAYPCAQGAEGNRELPTNPRKGLRPSCRSFIRGSIIRASAAELSPHFGL